jgi:hypothetical protein
VELSWLIKLRIAVVAALGGVVIGFLAWPLAAPSDPLAPMRFSDISLGAAITLVLLAFLLGFAAYFLSWPYGREIGILAAPAGLAVWAVRSGTMAQLMQLNPTLAQRQALFLGLEWEPVFWLLVVAAGFAGVLVGQKIRLSPRPAKTAQERNPNSDKYLSSVINVLIALAASVLIAQFFIRVFAQSVQMGLAVAYPAIAQPAVGQIALAVFVSFGLAAFAVKKFVGLSYIWPVIASTFVTAFSINIYTKQEVFEHFAQSWPATFFPNAVISVLPVQMVAFGTLGSIAGYWLAIRYNYWRKAVTEQ